MERSRRKKSKKDLRKFSVEAPYKPPKIPTAISESAAQCYRGYEGAPNLTHGIWPIGPKRSHQRIAVSGRQKSCLSQVDTCQARQSAEQYREYSPIGRVDVLQGIARGMLKT